MAESFKKFIDSNINKNVDEILPGFSQLLHNNYIPHLGAKKIIRLVFEGVAKSMSEEDKVHLKKAEELISTLVETSTRSLPKVRDTMFFPNPECENKLIKYLDMAKNEMLVCVFTITNNNLRDALIRAHNRHVKVQIISDDECMKQQGSDIQFLRDNGIPTETDTNPDAHMHNKFVVIDKEIVITGSFNWTIAAVNSNQENLLAIHDPEISAEYIEYFEGLWRNFRPVEVLREKAAICIQRHYRGSQARHKN